MVLTAAHCVEDLDFGGFTPAPTTRSRPAAPTRARTKPESVLRGRATPTSSPGSTPAPPTATPPCWSSPAPPPRRRSRWRPPPTAPLYAGGAPSAPGRLGPDPRQRPLGPGRPPLDRRRVLEPRRLQGADPRPSTSPTPPPSRCARRTRPTAPTAAASATAAARRSPTAPTAHRSRSGSPAPAARSCSTKLPNIFTRVDRVSTWAAEWIAATELGAPPPALKAQLPAMSRESAEGLVGRAAHARFGELFTGSQGLRGGCRRLGRGAAEMRTALALRAEALLRHRHRLLRAAAGHRRLGQQLRGQPRPASAACGATTASAARSKPDAGSGASRLR